MARAVLLVLGVLAAVAAGSHNIVDYGAVPNSDTQDAVLATTAAIAAAYRAANATTVPAARRGGGVREWAMASEAANRTVLVPAGAVFYTAANRLDYLRDVTLELEGELRLTDNFDRWDTKVRNNNMSALDFRWCDGLTITSRTGAGLIDGQGYKWWWSVLEGAKLQRPHLVNTEQSTNIRLSNFKMVNGPQMHVRTYDSINVHISDVEVWVNVEEQHRALDHHNLLAYPTNATNGTNSSSTAGRLGLGVPMFPFNTDGFDPSGANVLIERVKVQNFDDVVAVKPLNAGGNHLVKCTQNVTVRDSTVSYGVGMSIGSVPPERYTNCVRDVLIENVVFDHPFKAVYIKTNPGDEGDGIIDNIHYRNLTVHDSLWYPIWIGPQQQRQPGTSGTGCSFGYPLVDECPTQPRVSVSNILVEDVVATKGLLLPGVLLCNETNPCHNVTFRNVVNTGEFVLREHYVCKHSEGLADHSDPVPSCLTPM